MTTETKSGRVLETFGAAQIITDQTKVKFVLWDEFDAVWNNLYDSTLDEAEIAERLEAVGYDLCDFDYWVNCLIVYRGNNNYNTGVFCDDTKRKYSDTGEIVDS